MSHFINDYLIDLIEYDTYDTYLNYLSSNLPLLDFIKQMKIIDVQLFTITLPYYIRLRWACVELKNYITIDNCGSSYVLLKNLIGEFEVLSRYKIVTYDRSKINSGLTTSLENYERSLNQELLHHINRSHGYKEPLYAAWFLLTPHPERSIQEYDTPEADSLNRLIEILETEQKTGGFKC